MIKQQHLFGNMFVFIIFLLKKILNQNGLIKANVETLLIKRHSYGISDTKELLIKDFNVFATMPNLKVLDLFIKKKKNKKDDLYALNLKFEVSLPIGELINSSKFSLLNALFDNENSLQISPDISKTSVKTYLDSDMFDVSIANYVENTSLVIK